MEKAYKFRAYPSKEQQHVINMQMFLAKQLYNVPIEKSKQHFKDTGKIFTQYDMNKWITQLKKKNPEFQEIYSQVLQNVSNRVAKAYQNFFSRLRARKKGKKVKVGFPRFKKFVSSLTYPQNNKSFVIEKKRVEQCSDNVRS
ncbi:MAG: transposase [Candidatus Micrarchaeota archaeon]|nr:transposase [Candidatus Micrarchaeota archaeon]